MAPSRRKRKFRQLTLEQSMCRTDRNPVVIVENNRDDKATEQNPAPSEGSITRRLSPLLGSDRSESDDDFSEPDPDSSDEWLPSGSTGNSRSSSPDAAPRRHEGGRVSSRAHTPVGRAKKKGLVSSRGCEDDWHQASDLPADFLELFLTDELLQHIVDQTNLYARQYFEARPDNLPYSRSNAWKPVSIPELKSFFGLSFLTGYIKKPNLELYWSVDEVDATPHFSKTMARNRFQIIWRFLHYNNNALQNALDLEDVRRNPRAPYNTDPESRLDGDLSRHKLEHLMPTSKKVRPARKCRVCARRGLRSEMWCQSCCVPLHAGECFTAYHTKLNYSV
ncbi:piggyBac transposable element-derived protein 4-like isoform X2 [Sparus aurata]|uniref:piggyBac transposable element-derived protein 4-like isoform X2 n=1 Tax=Sparus aurata TaxID=8175 RepID=UPI0011C0E955|nr:piggyBac transposable element-derived protein 4-like isoform X2 [Sparus aurata]